MASFYYYDQDPSGLCFLVQSRAFIIETSLRLPNLNMKRKPKRILVVAVKWRHRSNGLLLTVCSLLRVTSNNRVRVWAHVQMLWKQRKRSSDDPAFSINSLRQEVDNEVNQKRIAPITGSWSGEILKTITSLMFPNCQRRQRLISSLTIWQLMICICHASSRISKTIAPSQHCSK